MSTQVHQLPTELLANYRKTEDLIGGNGLEAVDQVAGRTAGGAEAGCADGRTQGCSMLADVDGSGQ